MAKKQPGSDEPIVLGKFVKDIPVATDDAPPQFVIGERNGKWCKFPAAEALRRLKPKPGDCILGMRDDEIVMFYPAGRGLCVLRSWSLWRAGLRTTTLPTCSLGHADSTSSCSPFHVADRPTRDVA